MTSNKTILNR
uniref:Uncharacterized protein n=1 Tax=Arundo donax TaxID=35708 RepID=A0A0A8YV57_ARUDO